MYFNTLFYPHVFLQIFLNNNFQFLNAQTKRTITFYFLEFSGLFRNWICLHAIQKMRFLREWSAVQ